jgi:hypothetical protein
MPVFFHCPCLWPVPLVTASPNRKCFERSNSLEVTIVTIGKEDADWSRALTLPNLEELTLHALTQEQLGAIGELHSIKRLRITHAKLRSIDFHQVTSARASPMKSFEPTIPKW